MPDRTAADRIRQSVTSGLDAALIVTALGLMNALIVYATLGTAAAPFALRTAAVSLVVGGGVALLLDREIVMVPGPSASGALIVSALAAQLAATGKLDSGIGVVLFATAAVGVGAGVVLLVLARARLGAALKFIPYPVLMGFVDAVGVSLVVSVIPFALGHESLGRIGDVRGWFDGWRPASLAVTMVGTLAGYACVSFAPRAPAAFVALAVATLVHHAIAATCPSCALGPSLAFGDISLVPDLGLAWASRGALGLDGWALVAQSALTLGVLHAVFSLLTAAALTKTHDEPVDGNRLLAKIGGGGVASGLLLGLPVSLIASVSRAVRAPGVNRPLACATYVAATVTVFSFGHRLFATIPMAAVAASVFVISRMQFDSATWPLLGQALRGRDGGRAASGPLAIVALVVAIAVVRSFAAALFVGALAAACLLAIDLRRSVVLGIRDGRQRRSRRAWSAAERARLDGAGEAIVVIELAHWLYFGTVDDLVRLLDRHAQARWLLLDARRVSGIDLTAARSLVQASDRLAARGCRLVVAGIAPGDARLRSIAALGADQHAAVANAFTFVADVDLALEAAERDVLGDAIDPAEAAAAAVPSLDAAEVARLERRLETCRLAAGATLFRAGDPGDALYIVRRGRIRLSIDAENGTRVRLLSFGAGGVFGEIALLDAQPRSADAEAEGDCELWMLTRDAFLRLAVDDPPLHARLLHAFALQLAERLRANTTMLRQLS